MLTKVDFRGIIKEENAGRPKIDQKQGASP
jgi:hypothetical protein